MKKDQNILVTTLWDQCYASPTNPVTIDSLHVKVEVKRRRIDSDQVEGRRGAMKWIGIELTTTRRRGGNVRSEQNASETKISS